MVPRKEIGGSRVRICPLSSSAQTMPRGFEIPRTIGDVITWAVLDSSWSTCVSHQLSSVHLLIQHRGEWHDQGHKLISSSLNISS